MIKVLIVDDSIVSRQLLNYIFRLSGDIEVIGEAKDGQEALALIDERRTPLPDIITMDIEMPGIDGFETTRRILERVPVPIVIISNTLQYYSAEKAFRALQAGALGAIGKPPGLGSSNFYEKAKELTDLVKRLSQVKVKARTPTAMREMRPAEATHGGDATPLSTSQTIPCTPTLARDQLSAWARRNPPEIVAIGASTGGPPAIQEILAALPADFPLPIVVVQHISSGLERNFAEWLDKTCAIRCTLAAENDRIQKSTVYIAPCGRHVKVRSPGIIEFEAPGAEELIVPSVEALFHSVALAYGARSIGILLTGMGRDGSRGLLELKLAGALTLAQDRDSSVVYGMPGEAEKLGAACCHTDPSSIAEILTSLFPATPLEKEQNQ